MAPNDPRIDRDVVLDEVERRVLASGTHSTTPEDVAAGCGIDLDELPVGLRTSEELLEAMFARYMVEMDGLMVAALSSIELLSVESLVHVLMSAQADYMAANPAFLEYTMRSDRSLRSWQSRGDRFRQLGDLLAMYLTETGLAVPDIPDAVGELAIQTAARVLELAFVDGLPPRSDVLSLGEEMLVAWLERYAVSMGDTDGTSPRSAQP